MKILKSLFFIAFVLVLLTACKSLDNNKKESIVKISYLSHSGDKGGNFFNLQITKDSTILVKGDRVISKTFRVLTNESLWNDLRKINLNEFDKIMGSGSTTRHDGRDWAISISTNLKVHSVLNGKNIQDSKEMQSLINSLHSEMTRIQNKTED